MAIFDDVAFFRPSDRRRGRSGACAGHDASKTERKAWLHFVVRKNLGNLGSVTGPTPIEVDSVMEGNCIWRRALLADLEFDPILNFDDASMYGLDLSLQAKKRGFKVIYDPRAMVYHHPAPRAPELRRQERGPRLYCYCRNYTYIIMKRCSIWRRLVFLGWWFFIGERDAWGLGSLVFDTLSAEWGKNRHVAQAWRGKIDGLRLWSR